MLASAKLAGHAGVSHNMEDKLGGWEPLEALTTKLMVFSSQICAFAAALKGYYKFFIARNIYVLEINETLTPVLQEPVSSV